VQPRGKSAARLGAEEVQRTPPIEGARIAAPGLRATERGMLVRKVDLIFWKDLLRYCARYLKQAVFSRARPPERRTHVSEQEGQLESLFKAYIELEEMKVSTTSMHNDCTVLSGLVTCCLPQTI
jgi:hypothetical protein